MSANKVVFTFPFLPPSCNNRLEKTRWGGTRLSDAERLFKQETLRLVQEQWLPDQTLDHALVHKCTIIEACPAPYKSGVCRKGLDIDNGLKSMLDAVYRAVGLDDSRVKDLHKIQAISDERKTLIVIEPTTLLTWQEACDLYV